MEVWRNDSEDGEVRVAHGINSWPALLEQLSGTLDPTSVYLDL